MSSDPTPSRPTREHVSETDAPGPDEVEADDGPERGAEPDAVRRQRRARVFGETLPDATRDERGDEWGEREDRGGAEEWLHREVPPHHG